jgi:hypothetical protein
VSDRSTFGGTWTRPGNSGVGRNQRELQDRASFDQAPAAAGMSCLLALAVSGVLWALFISGLIAAAGVIA